MTTYVDQYQRLDAQASNAEAHADQYRARADQNRWEQCRIAHEAINSGEYNQTSFGQAVNRSQSYISSQFRSWATYGHLRANNRPSYQDAMAAVMGTTAEAETDRKQLSHAKRVLADPKLAKHVLADPDIQRSLMSNDRIRRDLTRTAHEVDAHRAARVSRQQRESAPRLAEAREYYDALARLIHARQDVNKALDTLRGLPPLETDQRNELREIAGWLSTSLEWLFATLKARRTASLSDEIESYLADQETS